MEMLEILDNQDHRVQGVSLEILVSQEAWDPLGLPEVLVHPVLEDHLVQVDELEPMVLQVQLAQEEIPAHQAFRAHKGLREVQAVPVNSDVRDLREMLDHKDHQELLVRQGSRVLLACLDHLVLKEQLGQLEDRVAPGQWVRWVPEDLPVRQVLKVDPAHLDRLGLLDLSEHQDK